MFMMSIPTFMLELFIISTPLCTSFQRADHFFRKAVISAFLLISMDIAWIQVDDIALSAFRYVVMLIAFFIRTEICYDESADIILYSVSATYALQTVFYNSYIIVLEIMMAVNWMEHFRWMNYIVYALMLVVCTYIVSKGLSKRILGIGQNNIESRILIIIAIVVVVLSNFINLYLIYFTSITEYDDIFILFKLTMSVACMLIICLQFNLLTNSKLASERDFLTALLRDKEEQYRMSKENTKLLQMKCHDMRYQIQLLKQHDVRKNDRVIEELEHQIRVFDGAAHTGNEVLDLILTEKSLLCEKEGIQLTAMLDGKKLNMIEPPDLYCLFGNAIDNAVEAVKEIEDVEKRIISISSWEQGNLFFVLISNYSRQKPEFNDGIPKTTKGDSDYHGFGVPSMVYIVKRYNGQLTLEQKEDIFMWKLLIPMAI